MNEKLLAIARSLADALSDFAYTRKDEDKKRVAGLQHELCTERKKELKAQMEKADERAEP